MCIRTWCAEISAKGFIVTEGLRTLARQQLLQAGATTTLRSRHLTGHAIDVTAGLNGEVRCDWPLHDRIAIATKAAAPDTIMPVEWGGDWPDTKNGPHYQLPWATYPA